MSNRRKLPRDRELTLSADVQAHVDRLAGELGDRVLNAYGCDTCAGVFVTIDKDRGVTPMFLACYATEDCKGRAGSAMYPEYLTAAAGDLAVRVTLEWFRPRTVKGLNDWEREHVKAGGLLHRPAVSAPDWVKESHRRVLR